MIDVRKFQRTVLTEYMARVGADQAGDLMLAATLDALGAAVQDADQAQAIAYALRQQIALDALKARLIACGRGHPALLLLVDPAGYRQWVLGQPTDDAPQLCISGHTLDLPDDAVLHSAYMV